MTPRERLEYGYRLAFYPPELNRFWNSIKRSAGSATPETADLLDLAMLLHQTLPERGYASQRALNRLALYQAKARAFGTLAFLRNIRRHLGLPGQPSTDKLPAHLVRDIALPPLCHRRSKRRPETDADRKIQVIRTAAKGDFPATAIDRMLAETKAGYSPRAKT